MSLPPSKPLGQCSIWSCQRESSQSSLFKQPRYWPYCFDHEYIYCDEWTWCAEPHCNQMAAVTPRQERRNAAYCADHGGETYEPRTTE